jgi:uncharacterized OB-fold protein
MSVTSDIDSMPYFDGLREGIVRIQRCDRGHFQHPPRALCVRCGTDNLAWIAISGRGLIYSHTSTHPRAADGGATPPSVSVALIDLVEGVRLVARLEAGADGRLPAIGDSVEVIAVPGHGAVTARPTS